MYCRAINWLLRHNSSEELSLLLCLNILFLIEAENKRCRVWTTLTFHIYRFCQQAANERKAGLLQKQLLVIKNKHLRLSSRASAATAPQTNLILIMLLVNVGHQCNKTQIRWQSTAINHTHMQACRHIHSHELIIKTKRAQTVGC